MRGKKDYQEVRVIKLPDSVYSMCCRGVLCLNEKYIGGASGVFLDLIDAPLNAKK